MLKVGITDNAVKLLNPFSKNITNYFSNRTDGTRKSPKNKIYSLLKGVQIGKQVRHENIDLQRARIIKKGFMFI